TDHPEAFIRDFLQRNSLDTTEVDAVILGENGDGRYDNIYRTVGSSLFANVPQIGFKHVVGEYDTVVSTALFVALGILQQQRIPQTLLLNGLISRTLQRIVIYTQRRGTNHSLILVER